MVIALIFVAFLFITFIVHRYIGLTNITNPIVPIYYYHTVFFLLALLYIGHYNHVEISQKVVFMILYGYVALFCSAVFFGRLLGVRNGRVVASNFVNNLSPKSSYLWAAFILQTLMLAVILFFFFKKGILLFAEDANNYRVEARKGLGFIIVIFRWVSEIFVVVGALHIFTTLKNSKVQVALFCVYYIVTIFFMLGLGSRAFVLDLVVIIIAIFYWSRCRDVDLKMILVGACCFFFLGLLGVFRQGFDVDLLLVFEKAIWRPFTNIQNFQWIVDDFSSFGFLAGESLLIELRTLLPGYQPNFGTWYKEEFGYMFTGGSITVTYLGEAYLNFGYIGVLVAPLLIGLFIAAVGRFFQQKNTFFWMFMSIMVSLSLKGIINVGVGATFVGTLLPVIFCLVSFMTVRYFMIVSCRG